MIKQIIFEEDNLILVDETGQRTRVPSSSFIKKLEDAGVANEFEDVVLPAQANYTTDLGDDMDITYTAVVAGTVGNTLAVRYMIALDKEEQPIKEQELAIVFNDNVLNVVLETNASGEVVTTAEDITDYIEDDEYLSGVFEVELVGDGSGVVEDFVTEYLSGGIDGTVARKGSLYFNDTYLYLATDDCTIAEANWKKIELTNGGA